MKWEGNRESDNVEDCRSSGGRPMLGGRRFGVNPLMILGLLSSEAPLHQM